MTDRERRAFVKNIQEVIQDKPWIMESPDGGKTISKHKFGEREKFYLSNVNGKWYNYEQALEAARERDREAELRAEHPSLADAYKTYQELLGLIEPDLVNNDRK
jgi:2-oxo-4-hydroxy-4-carboxy--5-ureidoimidazoline (OHCU) decarboxylase